MDIGIGMRAEEAVTFFTSALQSAQQAVAEGSSTQARDGALEVALEGDDNRGRFPVTITFNNDDMQRDEMKGRVIVDMDD